MNGVQERRVHCGHSIDRPTEWRRVTVYVDLYKLTSVTRRKIYSCAIDDERAPGLKAVKERDASPSLSSFGERFMVAGVEGCHESGPASRANAAEGLTSS